MNKKAFGGAIYPEQIPNQATNKLPMLSFDFLVKMAHDRQLSREQEEVFLLKFGESKNYEQIARELNVSKEACLKRMGGVYDKFGIEGETRGKENRLRIYLNRMHQQWQQEEQEKIWKHELNSLVGVGSHPSGVVTLEASDSVLELKTRMDKLIKALNISEQKQNGTNLKTPSEKAASKLPLEDPHQWIRQLRRKLIEGDGMNHVQETLQEFGVQLPAIIERIAATSQRTELEISLEILDRIAAALQNVELMSE